MPAPLPLWLIIHGLLPLMMVFLVYAGLWLRNQGQSLTSVIRNGGLWLYSVTLLAALLYDLTAKAAREAHIYAIHFAILVIVASSFLHGFSMKVNGEDDPKADRWTALAAFVVALGALTYTAAVRAGLDLW